MAPDNQQELFPLGRMWGRKWTLISAIIIIITGIGLYFFDNTDDSQYDPMDARPPAFKDTSSRGPIKLLNPQEDTTK
jgi:hypothetical protein